MASAFIIDIQSELSPDYEQANNILLEMLLNPLAPYLRIIWHLYPDGLAPIL